MRMALDLGLHRALEKLAEDNGKYRTEEEERNLGKHFIVLLIVILISSLQWCLRASGFACIGLIISLSWYFLYAVIVDTGLRRMSLGTGRPIVLRDENTIRHCRVLLSHPMASPTDVRLISLVELIAHKSVFFLNLTCQKTYRHLYNNQLKSMTFWPR